YIKYRVSQLTEASHQKFEEERLAKKWRDEQKRSAMEAAERQARTGFHRFIHTLLCIVCGLLTLLFGLGGFMPFTEGSGSGDSFAEDIGIAAVLFSIAFFFGWATRR